MAFGQKRSRGMEVARRLLWGAVGLAAGALVMDHYMAQRNRPPLHNISPDRWQLEEAKVKIPDQHVMLPSDVARRFARAGKSTLVVSTQATTAEHCAQWPSDRHLAMAVRDEQGRWQVGVGMEPLSDCYPAATEDEPDLCIGIPITHQGLDVCLGAIDDDGNFIGFPTVFNECLDPKQFADHYAGNAAAILL